MNELFRLFFQDTYLSDFYIWISNHGLGADHHLTVEANLQQHGIGREAPPVVGVAGRG